MYIVNKILKTKNNDAHYEVNLFSISFYHYLVIIFFSYARFTFLETGTLQTGITATITMPIKQCIDKNCHGNDTDI